MIYSVIVDISNSQVDKVYDYSSDTPYLVGQRVDVNFANRLTEGFIVAVKDTTDYDPAKIKNIIAAKDDFAAISSEMLALGTFMQQKYHLRFIDVLRLFIPAEMRGDRVKELTKRQAKLVSGVDVDAEIACFRANAVKQRELLRYLSDNGATRTDVLNSMFGNAALANLVKKGIVELHDITVRRTPVALNAEHSEKHTLTPAQQHAVDAIVDGSGGSFLLHGVTGSGKTEVYMSLIDNAVKSGKTSIMLVPEISLTPNMLRLFRNRFGDTVAILHSGLSKGERYDEWLRLKNGEARIAIGARSAIFAPIEDVGIIIIDEEHDASYISDSNPRYSTIDVARFRQKYNNATLVLGSATPSLESFHEAESGKLTLLTLPERINKQPLPAVSIVDMAEERRRGNKSFFSNQLVDSLTETVQKGNQAILFLNRRGYSSFLMCSKCGYVAKCADCDVSLTVHREDDTLKCHYCNKRYHMLTECPECHEKAFRQGKIGTQQVVDLLKVQFPDVKVLRMDADTTQGKEGHAKILAAFYKQEAQILVGTQMIAKGHDFPHVTLVGILDGDQSLYYSNYLATERTFQLLTQVAGRSGRDLEIGTVILQTYTPDHYCLQLASRQDYLSFYRREINLREASKFPPFSLIVRILYSGEKEKDCIEQLTKQYLRITELKKNNIDSFIYLDKMRCPVKRVEKKFRFQILMKLENTDSDAILQQIFTICDQKEYKDVSVFVETNPQNLA